MGQGKKLLELNNTFNVISLNLEIILKELFSAIEYMKSLSNKVEVDPSSIISMNSESVRLHQW